MAFFTVGFDSFISAYQREGNDIYIWRFSVLYAYYAALWSLLNPSDVSILNYDSLHLNSCKSMLRP